jgi:hypothetical protein
MIGSGGELYDVPAAEIAEMSRRGYRLESQDEAKHRQLQETYGGTAGEVGAFAHGVGKALTFGGLDVAGKLIGGDTYTETVKKLQEANPNAELAGEISGITGALFMPGGQGKALQGLQKLAAPVKSVAKLGRSVEKGVLKALGGPKGGVVRQALAKGGSLGAGAGVEGALYGAGEFVSEAALGEIEPTAENFLAHTKTGLMWGGAAGGALGASGPLIGKVLGTGKAFAGRSAKGIRRLWEKATGQKAIEGLDDALEGAIASPKISKWTKAQATAIAEDPAKLATLQAKGAAGKEARRIATTAADNRNKIVDEISNLRDQQQAILDEFTDQIKGRLKFANMESIAQVDNAVETAMQAQGRMAQLREEVAEMMAGAKTGEYGAKGAITSFNKSLGAHERRLQKYIRKASLTGKGNVAEEMHYTLDAVKRDIGKMRQRLGRVQMQDFAHQQTTSKFEQLYEGLRQHLEDPALYGAVAKAQKAVNAPWSRIIGRSPIARGFRKVVGQKEWRNLYATDRSKVSKFINNLGRAENRVDEEFLRAQISDELDLINSIGKAFELPSAMRNKLDEVRSISLRLADSVSTARKTVGLQNQLSDVIQKSNRLGSIMPMGAGAGVGYLLGGEEGAAAGLALSVFTNPGRMIQIRAAMERLSGDMNLQIGKAIKGYINKATGKIKPVAAKAKRIVGPTAQKVLSDSNWGDRRTVDKDRYQAFRRRAKELTEFVSNPQLAADRLTKNTNAISDAAPNLAAAVQMKALNAATFLHNKMPKPTKGTALLDPKFKPSEVDLVRFERYVEAVQDPTVLLRDLKKGMLTRETVEAVESVYPRMYEQIVLSLAEQIPALRDDLPYKERVNLSTLFQIPVDQTMEPRFYQTMQMLAMAPPPEPQPRGPSATAQVWGKIKAGQVALTETQRVQAESA